MDTILTLRPWSVRLVAGAFLAGLIVVAALLARVLPRTASSAPNVNSAAALPVATAYTRYLDMKERQAEQRDSLVVARPAAITAPGPRERYEAMKERQFAQRDTAPGAVVATAPGPRERYETMKERQFTLSDTAPGAVVATAPGPRERYEAMKERQFTQRDGAPSSTESAPLSATRLRPLDFRGQQADARDGAMAGAMITP